ncbi:MAG: hypothetical protein ACLPKE_34915 [Streptosporangiaceae bacterium]
MTTTSRPAGWRLGQLVQAWQVRDRLQNRTRQEPGLEIAQLPQAPAQGGQLSVVDATGLGAGQHGGDAVGRIHALFSFEQMWLQRRRRTGVRNSLALPVCSAASSRRLCVLQGCELSSGGARALGAAG